MGRTNYTFKANRPLEAAAYVEKLLDEEKGLSLGIAFGAFSRFESNIYEYRSFFYSTEEILEDLLEGICKIQEEDNDTIKKSKFSLLLSDCPREHNPDLASATLSREYEFQIESTKFSLIASATHGNSWIMPFPTYDNYSLCMTLPKEDAIFKVQYHPERKWMERGIKRMTGDISASLLPNRYRKHLSKAILDCLGQKERVSV